MSLVTRLDGLVAQDGTVMVGFDATSVLTATSHVLFAVAGFEPLAGDLSDELPHAATPNTMVAARARTPIALRIPRRLPKDPAHPNGGREDHRSTADVGPFAGRL